MNSDRPILALAPHRKANVVRVALFCFMALAGGIAPGTSLAADTTSDLTILNTAIQKMLMDELFIDKGRYPLLPPTACQYAYVDSPAVTLSEGRVRIKARVSAKLAVEVGSECVGSSGDMVNVTVSGRPVFSGENIMLTDIKVDDVSKEAYRLLLQQFLESAVPRAVQINVREGLQRVLATRQSSYDVVINKLSVVDLTADNNQLHASLTFSLLAR